MIVLGIDPGTAKMGWGVVESQAAENKKKNVVRYVDHGMIETPATDPLPQRLLTIRDEVGKLMSDYEVGEVVIERVVFNVNKRSAISVAQAYGAVMVAAAELEIPVHEYNSLEVKLSVAGYGRADKKSVQQQVKCKLCLKKCPTPNHAADALAVALCHILKDYAA